LALTLGSDLRGRTSADAAFQLALSGAAQSSHIFDALVNVGIHELNRAGYRSSFKPIYVLQMVEKFAACGIKSSSVKELYYTAGLCLEAKGHHDAVLIDSLKKDDFGLHSDRPLLWLWRFSARQKKITLNDNGHKYNTFGSNFSWDDYFHDTSKGLVVDIGCGCGVSLLNLSRIDKNEVLLGNQDDVPGMEWSDYNYAGIDLNKQLVDYANGVVSRLNHNDGGRINFFCSPAIELLKSLQIYAGRIEIIMIQFPSPYRLSSEEPRDGNSQLPSTSTEGYMISRDVVQVISKLLKKNNGTLLLQTKCEDVAVYTKNLFLEGGDLECLPCSSTVWNIDNIYERNQLSRPQRVNKWLRQCPEAERAEGEIWSSRPLLPLIGRTETEVNCDFENTHVHRFKISSKKGEFIKNKNLK
jgi:SAM-dependent methyltransferase